MLQREYEASESTFGAAVQYYATSECLSCITATKDTRSTCHRKNDKKQDRTDTGKPRVQTDIERSEQSEVGGERKGTCDL
jgi:hypothetical protein